MGWLKAGLLARSPLPFEILKGDFRRVGLELKLGNRSLFQIETREGQVRVPCRRIVFFWGLDFT